MFEFTVADGNGDIVLFSQLILTGICWSNWKLFLKNCPKLQMCRTLQYILKCYDGQLGIKSWKESVQHPHYPFHHFLCGKQQVIVCIFDALLFYCMSDVIMIPSLRTPHWERGICWVKSFLLFDNQAIHTDRQ